MSSSYFAGKSTAFMAVGLLAYVCVVSVASAQSDGSTNPVFSIHGYLNQAYGKSDRLPIQGLNKSGTFDYRVLAVQLRSALTDRDQFVVQLRNRRIGTSLIGDDGITLDWAYYMHNFGIAAIKIGRVPLSHGIYNEIRNVGTLMPFFRAPPNLYVEGTETVTGTSVSNRTQFGLWTLESIVYFGQMEFPVQIFLPTGSLIVRSNTIHNYGGSAFLETPLEGLRVGVALLNVSDFPITATDSSDIKSFGASIDGTFDKFLVRTEYQRYVVPGLINPGDENVASYYVQASANVIGKFWLNAQHEYARFNAAGDRFVNSDDRAVGINYKFSDNAVAKIEGHRVTGYAMDRFNPRPLSPGKTNYGLASLSVSF